MQVPPVPASLGGLFPLSQSLGLGLSAMLLSLLGTHSQKTDFYVAVVFISFYFALADECFVHVCAPCVCAMPTEARRGSQLQPVVTTCGCWEPNLGPRRSSRQS